VRISPAIIPISVSNPSYQVYSYNTQDLSLFDETRATPSISDRAPPRPTTPLPGYWRS